MATLQWKPLLDGSIVEAEALAVALEIRTGKEIICQDEKEKAELKLIELEQQNNDLKLGLAISIPGGILVAVITTLLISNFAGK